MSHYQQKIAQLVLVTEIVGRKPQREQPRMGLDNQRIRFNWGYHDGASDVRNVYKTTEERQQFAASHFDRAYAEGHAAGDAAQTAGTYTNDSMVAWVISGRSDDFAGWRQ